jgi:hypothetical protein
MTVANAPTLTKSAPVATRLTALAVRRNLSNRRPAGVLVKRCQSHRRAFHTANHQKRAYQTARRRSRTTPTIVLGVATRQRYKGRLAVDESTRDLRNRVGL